MHSSVITFLPHYHIKKRIRYMLPNDSLSLQIAKSAAGRFSHVALFSSFILSLLTSSSAHMSHHNAVGDVSIEIIHNLSFFLLSSLNQVVNPM